VIIFIKNLPNASTGVWKTMANGEETTLLQQIALAIRGLVTEKPQRLPGSAQVEAISGIPGALSGVPILFLLHDIRSIVTEVPTVSP